MPGNVLIVTQASVGNHKFGEGVAEKVHPALRSVVGRIAVGIVAVLRKCVHRALGSQGKVRVRGGIAVAQKFQALCPFEDAVNIGNGILA